MSNEPGGPKTAVIIVSHNAGEHLRRCLYALRCQTYPPTRIMLVDNASTNAADELRWLRDYSVELLALDRNIGFAAANNLAVGRAEDCELIALLNPDAFPEPAWLGALVAAAGANPGHASFASRLVQAGNRARLDGAGDAYHTSGLAWRRLHGCPAAETAHTAREVFAACAAAAMYRRSSFLEVGGFDEDYFCYLEDVDLGFRLRLAGYKCLYVPAAVAYHVGSATTGRHSSFSVYHGHRNLVWTYLKNMPGALFWFYLPQHLLLNLMSVPAMARRGQGGLVLKTKKDAVAGLAGIWRKRREIQSRRTISVQALRRILARGWPRHRACP